jgi:hypothetical protein
MTEETPHPVRSFSDPEPIKESAAAITQPGREQRQSCAAENGFREGGQINPQPLHIYRWRHRSRLRKRRASSPSRPRPSQK